MGSHCVVLLSGGVDSIVCATREHRAGRLAACLFVHYGQPAGECEWVAARQWCRTWGVPLSRLDMGLRGLAEMTAPAGEAGARVVPGRNAVLIAHAVNLAASIGAGRVVYGATAADHGGYPDCRPEFVAAASAAARASGVAVEAPLINLDKSAVMAEARRLGVNINAAWSCYTPVGEPGDYRACGTCDSCVSRGSR